MIVYTGLITFNYNNCFSAKRLERFGTLANVLESILRHTVILATVIDDGLKLIILLYEVNEVLKAEFFAGFLGRLNINIITASLVHDGISISVTGQCHLNPAATTESTNAANVLKNRKKLINIWN